ncbi:EamA-like transporter family protein [compost metagenome]
MVCVGLVLVTPEFDLASGATTGLLWSVLSGLLFSLLSLTNRASSARIPPVQAALCQNVVVALCLLPAAAPHLSEVRAIDWLWIGLLGVFCTGVAHSLFVASLAVIKARTAAVVFALEPVYGITMAWLLFNENPTLRMLLGGALIIVAIVVSSRLAGSSSKKAVAAEAASH